MFKTAIAAAVAAGAVCWTAAALAQSPSQLQAQTFMATAIRWDTTEIMLGKMAEKKASSPAVRQLADKVVKGHTWWRAHAEQVARRLGVSLPYGPSSKGKEEAGKLQTLTGPAFDKAFVNDMVKNHEQVLVASRSEARVHDGASQFAAASVPALRKLLNEAQNVQKSMA